MSIPKIIHYCWFGRNPKPELAEKCLRSWKKFCPDYKIIEWNEDNYLISQAPLYVRQAYEKKKWAFVTDYVRLQVVYEQGGIYLDTDVELLKPLDPLLSCSAYFGFETDQFVATGLGFGAEPGNPVVQKMMEDYEGVPFLQEDGSIDPTPCPQRNTKILLQAGLIPDGSRQQLPGGVLVLPRTCLAPIDIATNRKKVTADTISIHWYSASWYTKEDRKARRKDIWYNRLHWITRIPNKLGTLVFGKQRYEKIRDRIKGK